MNTSHKLRDFLGLCTVAALLACPLPTAAQAADPSPGSKPQETRVATGKPAAAVRTVRIAAVAVATVDGMVESNYARALRLAEISLKYKPDIILLPEAFAAGYCGKPLAEFAEDGQKSEHLARFRKLSADGGCMIVVCYLEKVPGDRRVRNVAAIYDRGQLLGRHYKHSLWVDRDRPYRDEPSQMIPGGPIEIYATRLGRFAVLICFENMLPANLDALRGKVDYVLSPYNSEHDLSDINIGTARRLGIPSAWVDRTGTVYCGDDYMTNLGTGGMVDARGRIIKRTPQGAESIAVGEIPIPAAAPVSSAAAR